MFSLAPGNYPNTLSVTITDATPGATIYYTVNGSYPSTSSSVYSGAITVPTSEVLVAYATVPGYTDSPNASAAYFIASSNSSFIYTLAGNDSFGYSGDGGSATLAQINQPTGALMDTTGNLYIVDAGNNAIRKVAANTGIITTIAGNGIGAHTGDNGPALNAELWWPHSIAIDRSGNLFIGETGDGLVRKIDASSGVITTYAGNPNAVSAGDNGPANQARLTGVAALTTDAVGNLYIAGSTTIRKVDATTNIITTIAGGGSTYGDNGPATSAQLRNLAGVAIDSLGNLYISDNSACVVREVTAGTGIITTIAGIAPSIPGGGCAGPGGGDGGLATAARLWYPNAIAIDGQNNLYIADSQDNAIRRVDAHTLIISTFAGIWTTSLSVGGDGDPATSVSVQYPVDIWGDAAGNIYLSNYVEGRVQKITPLGPPPSAQTATPVFSVPSGTYSTLQAVTLSDPTPGAAYYVSFFDEPPPGTAGQGFYGSLDVTGSLNMTVVAVAPGYLPSAPASINYTITTPPASIISTIAGAGVGAYSSTGGPAASVFLGLPRGIAIDNAGNLYFSDYLYSVVWKLTAGTDNLSVLAGTGVAGFSDDNGPATSAQLNYPSGVAVDRFGNVYIADGFNNRVRMVAAQTGIITTIAGPGTFNALGDGGPASAAYVSTPAGLALDTAGNLYIADSGNQRIRVIAAATGLISTVAGGGTGPGLGDGGLATQALLYSPQGIVLDKAGNIYIADESAARIRMVSVQTGLITTIAGNGDRGNSGDGGPAIAAEVDPQQGLAIDSSDNVYFSSWADAVRKIAKTDGTISTVAGTNYGGYGGDGGAATAALLCNPQGLTFDSFGSFYIADACNGLIRKVTFPTPAATPNLSLTSGTYNKQQNVTITDSTPNAAIYYTTDGTAPTTASDLYSGSITIAASETLRAIAVATGYAQSAIASATYSIQLPPITYPTIHVSLSSSTISTSQSLVVAITVTGGAGYPVPTGTIVLTSGSYGSGSASLNAGNVSINLPPGTLPVGNNIQLLASYTPDNPSASVYYPTSQGSNVTVTLPPPSTPTVTVTPSAESISVGLPLAVNVTVSGSAGGAIPTGHLLLIGPNYSSGITSLVSGSGTFQVPAGILSMGTGSLTANYYADEGSSALYNNASGTTALTVTPETYTMTATALSVNRGVPGASSVTISSTTGYVGTVSFSCTVTSYPAGASHLPTCTSNQAVTLSTVTTTGTALMSIYTTGPTTALATPALPSTSRWHRAAGGAALAMLAFFFVPRRSRLTRTLLGLACLIALTSGIVACGGGASGGGGAKTPADPGTTPGNYTVTLTGTGNTSLGANTSTTFTLTVN